MKYKICYCGGRYRNGSCGRNDCPRATLGHGSWHIALPKLRALNYAGKMCRRYPDLDLRDLGEHVAHMEARKGTPYPEHEIPQREGGSDRRQDAVRGRSPRRQRVVLDRRRSDHRPDPHVASSSRPQLPLREATRQGAASSSRNGPIKIEPTEESEGYQDEEGEEEVPSGGDSVESNGTYWTVPDSDESDASIYGLRRILHEVEEGSEISAASSDDDDERSLAEREAVLTWREANEMLDDIDFAYCYKTFEEAYGEAGQPAAVAWSRARLMAEPNLASDVAKVSKIDATTTKIKKVDRQRHLAISKRRKITTGSYLRQPGKGTEIEEVQEDKLRFVEPLAQLMKDCKVGHSDNITASDDEIINSHRRKATRMVEMSEVVTLHRAVTTADELRKYLNERPLLMNIDAIEPIALEEFLLQSHAQGRVWNALGWMCKNLEVGWPLHRAVKPITKKPCLVGLNCKQAPVAQPGMLKALSDAIEAGAETDCPTWLALLASWLQSLGNIRLGHILRRSFPVEVLNGTDTVPGWILFFCKIGKQKHNRDGFYWGAPSELSSGYDWTVKFLAEYNLRRESDKGGEKMGMIFRLDTLDFLSARAVNALTIEVVSGSVENPQILTTYSWRRMLPTIALHLKFDSTERVAIGDWKDTKKLSNEAPITLRYAEGKAGISRACKLICAAALNVLDNGLVQNFAEVSHEQWAEIATKARTMVEAEPFDLVPSWRNPDVAVCEEGFITKKSQLTFPRQLNGIVLTPCSKDKQKYCADFQGNNCGAATSPAPQQGVRCSAGLHKCAALYRSGRACHGNHPGAECTNTRKHVRCESQEDNPEESPAPKRARREDPDSRHSDPGPARSSVILTEARAPAQNDVEVINAVEDDSIMQDILHQVARDRDRRRGNRLQPEPPRLVAKVCEEPSKGEIWLGPLPTNSRLERINETKFSIQVYCFMHDPEEVTVTPKGEAGIQIPGTLAFRCEMSNIHKRGPDLRALLPCLINSLRQGDNAYIHCVSGISRAPVAAAITSAKLMNTTFEKAKYIIGRVRNVKFEGYEGNPKDLEGPWIDGILHMTIPETVAPTGFSSCSTRDTHRLVHASVESDEGLGPICRWKRGPNNRKHYRSAVTTVTSLELAAAQFGGRFCSVCTASLRASLRVKIDELW